jgi:FdhD protein
MAEDSTSSVDVVVYDRDSRLTPSARTVVKESALVIGVNGESDYAIMRTPGHDRELAVGFLVTEGMIDGVKDINMLSQCQDTPDSLIVRTIRGSGGLPQRNLVVNSSCGLCGRADIGSLVKSLPVIPPGFRIAAAILNDIPGKVRAGQSLFESTGATHAAALFDREGGVAVIREDIGRHNAVDKVVGHALFNQLPVSVMGLFLSGRTSLELIVKAARVGIPLVVSVSAPTDAAITVAGRVGITLVGFARGDGFTVYSNPGRLDS